MRDPLTNCTILGPVSSLSLPRTESLVCQIEVVLTCKVVSADAIIAVIVEVFLPIIIHISTKSAIALETIIAASLSLLPTEIIVC